MELEIKSFSTQDDLSFSQVRKIREIVFVDEQKVNLRDEFDEFEDDCLHYSMCFDKQLVGTARWRAIGEQIKLERFAVLKEFRGKGLGDLLLKRVITDATKENKLMYLHAQIKAVSFYERRGFEKVGDLFVECDIKHYKMTLHPSKVV